MLQILQNNKIETRNEKVLMSDLITKTQNAKNTEEMNTKYKKKIINGYIKVIHVKEILEKYSTKKTQSMLQELDDDDVIELVREPDLENQVIDFANNLFSFANHNFSFIVVDDTMYFTPLKI
jgi:Mg/Co/Ni transporter MgtE